MDQEIVCKTLLVKESLTPIRNIVVWARSILVWQKSYYPPLIGSLVTIFFIFFWLIDQNVLPKLCMIAIMLTMLDYLLPKVNLYLASSEWSDKQEASYQASCEAIASVWVRLAANTSLYFGLKQSNTKLYYGSLLLFLVLLIWIGNAINNLFLAYLLAMFAFYYPGLSYHNMLDKVAPFVYNLFGSLLSRMTSTARAASSSSSTRSKKHN